MTTRGYLTLAENTPETDYLRLAYGLALSIKATQSQNANVSVGVSPSMTIPKKYKEVFDQVIILPWEDNAEGQSWKLENEWKAYHITPYDETVKLDSDMLFLDDISHWWDLLALKDFWATTQVYTYRQHLVTSDYYRKLFTSNELPNIYTAFMYFKKSELSHQIFEMAELIFQNSEKFFYEFLDESRPKKPSTDVVFALAIKLLDVIDDATCKFDDLSSPSFVHMKPNVQGWKGIQADNEWYKTIPSILSADLNLKVGTHKQVLPFHYVSKTFLTDDIIQKYEYKLGIT